MFNLKKSLIALITVLTLYGVEARGDSFEINNVQGSVFVSTYADAGPLPFSLKLRPYFSLGGPGLGIISTFPPFGGGDVGHVEARDTCMATPCTPGMVIGTNSSFSGIIAPRDGGYASVYGVLYPFVRLTGALNFSSSPIVLPDRGSFRVTIPFTFSGDLAGEAFQPDVVNPIFTATLSGRGLAKFSFTDMSYWFGTSSSYRLSYIEYRFEPVQISIDIKPATFPNSINPSSKGKIPVAILTDSFFDATTVDPTTVLFGATGNQIAPVHSAFEDVDGDGDVDVVLHFVTQDTAIACGNAFASLTGATFSGVKIKGSDSIETVACN